MRETRLVGMSEEPVRVVGIDDVDESGGRSPPPIWVVVVVVLAVVGAGGLLTSPPDVAESTPTVTPSDTSSNERVRKDQGVFIGTRARPVPENQPSLSSSVFEGCVQAPGFGPGDFLRGGRTIL